MWRVVLGMLVALGMAAAVYIWQQAEATRFVSTVAVVRGSIDSRLQLTGSVINDRTVTLTALLDGEITSILAREGDKVEAGDVLAELDSRQARAMVDQASAELVLQEQALEASTRNLARIERLSRVGSVSVQSRDDGRDAQIEARASLHAARATLTMNQLILDNALIRSPFSGTVIEQSAETGQWLEAGTPLFRVVASEGTVIEAGVSASDWPRLSVGQPVTLSSDDSDGVQWASDINWIAPTVDTIGGQAKNVAIRISPTEKAPPLLLGQDVDVDVLLQRNDDVLVVPLQVLQENDVGEFSVFVLNDGTAQETQLTIGLTSLEDAEVISGLTEGDRVIIPVGKLLQDGQAVRDYSQ
ncbi:MAG: efflux RND transporter periplasmic adaptor subunit [Granulosicoccus sp.]